MPPAASALRRARTWNLELRRLAAERYQITVAFTGCVIGPKVAYDRAYREAVTAHLKDKHGFDPVAKIEAELRAKQK